MNQLLTDIHKKLEGYLAHHEFNMMLIGHEIDSHIVQNYAFSDYFENYENVNKQLATTRLLVIVGYPNLNQIEVIKYIYEKLTAPKKVLLIKGAIAQSYREKSYFLRHDITETLPVDYIYNTFPTNVAEISQVISQILRGENIE